MGDNEIARSIVSGIIAVIISVIVHHFIGKCEHSTDLEIYTQDNIYYVEGKKVTNENNDEVYTFKDKESLKEYISNVTSK